MAVLFMGIEAEDYGVTSGTIVKDNNNYFDANYARCSVGPNWDATSYLQGTLSAASASFWMTVRYGCGAHTAGYVPLSFQDGDNDRLRFKLVSTVSAGSTSDLAVYRVNGGTEALVGTVAAAISPTSFTSNITAKLDFKVIYSSTGSVEVYHNGVLKGTVTGDLVGTSGSTALSSFRLKSMHDSSPIYRVGYSEVVVATGSTLGMRVKTLAPNAAGDLSAWTGTYQNVDEVLATDTDVINSAVAAQEWSCNLTGLPAGSSGQKVRAIKIACEAAKGDSGPSAIGLGVRTGGSTAYQSDQACSLAYTSHTALLETNPVTGQLWTTTELEALQIAFRSA
jgi:hypothetical protein